MSAASATSHWTVERDQDGVAWLTLDRTDASANSLSRAVMEELDAKLASLAASPPKAVVVASGKQGGFIAGADIKEFVGLQSPEQAFEMIRAGQQVLERLAQLPCRRSPRSTVSRSAAVSRLRWRVVIGSSRTTPRSRSASPKCSSACIRDWAARFAPCSSPDRSLRWI